MTRPDLPDIGVSGIIPETPYGRCSIRGDSKRIGMAT